MPAEERLYRVAEIAAALGQKHKPPVRALLGAPFGSVHFRGKTADGWRKGDLPAGVLVELEQCRRLHHFGSIAALLENAPPLYEHPFRPDAAATGAAQRRRDVLAPLLQRRAGESIAEAGADRLRAVRRLFAGLGDTGACHGRALDSRSDPARCRMAAI